MISVTLRLKRTWDSLITPSGCARLVPAHLAATCKTVSGLREIVYRPLPEVSILRNLFRFFPQTAYLSGRCTRIRQPMQLASQSKSGRNASANEKNPDHSYPA